jgi:hypothetical protein
MGGAVCDKGGSINSGLTLLSPSKKVRDAFQAYYYVINPSKRHTMAITREENPHPPGTCGTPSGNASRTRYANDGTETDTLRVRQFGGTEADTANWTHRRLDSPRFASPTNQNVRLSVSPKIKLYWMEFLGKSWKISNLKKLKKRRCIITRMFFIFVNYQT